MKTTRRRYRATPAHLAVLLTAAVTGAATTARAEDWASPGLDGGHTRLSTERSGLAFGDGRWTFAGSSAVLASPIVADGFVVTADLDGSVRAVRADDGQLVWQVPAGLPIPRHTAPSQGPVFPPAASH